MSQVDDATEEINDRIDEALSELSLDERMEVIDNVRGHLTDKDDGIRAQMESEGLDFQDDYD